MSDAPDDGANRREIAYRLFAAEYDDADLSYSEGDEERAPNYVVTPTGARVNRTFFVGVLTEVEAVSEDVLRARVVDPTGAFVLYAGQYQPDEQAFLEGAGTPTFVAVTGKARTFQPEDADRVYTSIRPETINEVDADTRDRWTVGTAERTLQRVGWIARAIASDRRGSDLETALVADGADEGFAAGIVRALDHYGTSPAYLSGVADMALDAARLVAGETDEAETVSVPPDAAGEADLDTLAGYADLATVHGDESTASTAGTETSELETATESGSGVAEHSGGTESGSPGESTGDAATVQATETAPVASADSDDSSSEVDTPADSGPVESSSEVDTPADSGSKVDTPAVSAGGVEQPGDHDGAADTDETTADVGDFEPGEFDLDDEEREEIEEEFGTDFQSGTEVEEPGEADIETPEPDAPAAEDDGEQAEASDTTATDEQAEAPDTTATDEQAEASDTTATDEQAEAPDTTATDEQAEASDTTATDEQAEAPDTTTATDEPAHGDAEGTESVETDDVDLEDATLDVMAELDDGAGADRQALLEEMTDRHGVDPEAIEEAIQDALMDGRCYEPDDATLKPI